MDSQLTKPEVILTHESDLDGLVSGLLLQKLAERVFDVTPKLQAYQHVNWRHRIMREDVAWVSDLGADKRIDKKNWTIFDHHAVSYQPTEATFVHDPKQCATALAYEQCKANGVQTPSLDRLVKLTNIVDLFHDSDPDFELANDYGSLVKSYGFWSLRALIDSDPEKLVDHPLLDIMRLKREVEDPMGFEWSSAHLEELSDQAALVYTTVGNTNLIIHRMLKEKVTPYSVLITASRKSSGMIALSLRSRDESALPIAIKLQGGGHPNACGASLPNAIQNIPDAIGYLRRILNPVKVEEPAMGLEAAFDSL
jgi:oligoribonuclease NrnB/cAMP/cGMP phosphodiesterase (DHH superfamily)